MRIDAWHNELLRTDPAYAAAVAEMEADPREQLADEILALRMKAGLTQVEVAKLARTTQAMVSRLECAEGNPKLATVHRVLAALRRHVEADWDVDLVQRAVSAANVVASATSVDVATSWTCAPVRLYSGGDEAEAAEIGVAA